MASEGAPPAMADEQAATGNGNVTGEDNGAMLHMTMCLFLLGVAARKAAVTSLAHVLKSYTIVQGLELRENPKDHHPRRSRAQHIEKTSVKCSRNAQVCIFI